MSKRNPHRDVSKLKNALAYGYAEGFGPMLNIRHPRKMKLPLLQKEPPASSAKADGGKRSTP